MRLSNAIHNEIKAEVSNVAEQLKKHLEANKEKMSTQQIEAANDALAIANVITSMNDVEQIKTSSQRMAKLVKAAFSEDVANIDMREDIKNQALDGVKAVEPRSLGENKRLEDQFPDNATDSTAKKTKSPYDHTLMAERILRDVENGFYLTVSDAYDGYCQEGGAYLYASSFQKASLGKHLRGWGFKVSFEPFEKEAEKEKKEFLKRLNRDNEIQDKLEKKASGFDQVYCPSCKETTKHQKNADSVTCLKCGSKKRPVNPSKKSNKTAGLDEMLGLGQIGVLDAIATKLARLFSQNKTPITRTEIEQSLPQEMKGNPMVIDSMLSKLEDQFGVPTQRNAAKEVKGNMYACGNGMCGYSERMAQQGDFSCPKCGKKLVLSKDTVAVKKTACLDKFLKATKEPDSYCDSCDSKVDAEGKCRCSE